jgi:hypothetical protein
MILGANYKASLHLISNLTESMFKHANFLDKFLLLFDDFILFLLIDPFLDTVIADLTAGY